MKTLFASLLAWAITGSAFASSCDVVSLDSNGVIHLYREYGDEGQSILSFVLIAKSDCDTLLTDVSFEVAIKVLKGESKVYSLVTTFITFYREEFINNALVSKNVQFAVRNSTLFDEDLLEVIITPRDKDKGIGPLKQMIMLSVKQPSYADLIDKMDKQEIGEIRISGKSGEVELFRKRSKKAKREQNNAYQNEENDRIKLRDQNFEKKYVSYDLARTPGETINTEENDFKIDSVSIIISEGRITFLRVYLKEIDEPFTNNGPISITNMYRRRYYELRYSGKEDFYKDCFIPLGQVVSYFPTIDRMYYPSKDRMTLTTLSPISKIYSESNPRTFLEARVFTDISGLSGNQNGLVQTEINARVITNSNANFRGFSTLFQYFNMGISWSKFDSNSDTLFIPNFGEARANEILRLTQQAFSNFYFDADIIRATRVLDFYVKVGHNLAITRVSDKSNNTFRRVFTPSIYVKSGMRVYNSPWIKVDFNIPCHFVYLYDDAIIHDQKTSYTYIAPEIELSMNLRKPEPNNEKNRAFIFARVRYYDLVDRGGNNFWQLQTGVEIPISSFINGKMK